MSQGFNVMGTAGPVAGVDPSGNIWSTGTLNVAAGTVTGTFSTPGIQVAGLGGGANTAASANYLNATIGAGAAALLGTAATGTQLSDLSRDYMVYLGVTAGGAAATLSIGPASTAVSTLFATATCNVGTQYTFRLPAGWYIRFQGTAGITQQTAISC